MSEHALLDENDDPRYARLNADRAHGTRGEWLCFCPACRHQWRASVRWDKQAGRFKLLAWQGGCCRECWNEHLAIVPGMKLRRLSDYDGPLTEKEDRRC